MRIGVITNPRAGRISGAGARARSLLERHPGVLYAETSASEPLKEALAGFAREGVELLVVNGGDGTLQRTLTGVLAGPPAYRPLVAPLRVGRTNTSALTMGVQRDPVRAVERILDAARSGALDSLVHERPVVRVELGGGAVEYGMFFGAGILYNAIRFTHARYPEGRAQGVLGATVTTVTLIGRALLGRFGGVLSPEKVHVALDGRSVHPEAQEFVIVMAMTLDRLFARMRPFWGTGPGPLRFSTISPKVGGFRNAVGILRGRGPARPNEGFISENVETAALRLDGGLTIDGELIDPEPGRTVRLSAHDRVRFVIG